jgi:Secretion system C-terminal sorting domain
MKNLSTLLIVMLLSSVTALFAQAPDEGDAAFVAAWTAPIPSWWAALPADYQAKKQAVATKSSTFDAVGCNFDVEWAKIPGDGNKLGDLGSRLGLAASDKGDADFSGAFKVIYDDANIYILLQYTDDDVTGNETVEIAWAPYLKIKAPDLATLPQAWYTRYTQFGAYKATFKNTGFDAAMMVNGSNGNVNWGGTNDILSTNLFMDNHSTVGSKTIKYIYTIGYAALTGEARPAFDASVWQALNEGKGITFDMKVNDVDTDDALSADAKPVKKPAEYWWNTKNNDCYALTIYAGFLSPSAPVSADAAYVKGWTAPIPSWWAALPAEEPTRKQAVSPQVATFDALGSDFDAVWAKIPGDGNKLGDTGSRLGLAASDKGDADFSGSFKTICDDANIYVLLQYTDDDVTGNETVEIAWAPYLKIDAPVLAALPQAWYARYKQFGAYKATFKSTGFDAAMMIDGSTGAVNWGGTNDILSSSLFMDNHTAVGSKTIKQIYTIGYAALTGEARPDFNLEIWKALNAGKGISLDMKVNDVDTDDALSADATPVKKPAEYWWNTKNNNCYALTTYAGFLKVGDPVAFLPTITSFVDNFDGTTVSPLWVPEHATDTPKVFVLTQASGTLNLNIDKNAGIDAGIGVYGFSALLLDMSTTSLLDLTVNPKVSISLKADKPLSLQVGLVQSTVGGNSVTISVTVPGDGAYHTYNFDFTGKLAAFYDPKQIDKVYLNFNPGWATGGYYKGNVTLDYLKIGDAALTGLNRLYNPADLSVYPNPAKTTIALKNSSSLNIQSIALVNMSGQIVKQINNYNGGSINVEDLRSGVYFVRVTTQDNALNTLKFIKQ